MEAALFSVSFNYADESNPGPYPLPSNAPIEGGSQSSGDRHVIVVDSGTCRLYEMYASYPQSNGSWKAGSGAVWSLNSDSLRPSTWTSADAAGLPLLPGLVRYDEIASGIINHALRFTVKSTQRAFLWPARHEASSGTNPNLPPMGLRLPLKAPIVSTPPATHTAFATTTRTHAPSSIMTPEIAESINRNNESNTRSKHTPSSSGSNYILPFALVSIAILLTMIIAGSRVLWARRSRK